MTAEDAKFPRWLDVGIRVFIGIGVLARLTRYFGARPLWADEATMALVVIERTTAELLVPNVGDPVTPVGFLLATKGIEQLMGGSELALRLLPLLAGLVSLPICYALAREFLPRREALVSLLLFSLSEPLIFYSSELKQYSTDVFVALLILWAGARLLQTSDAPARRLAIAAAAGAVGIWFSLPAIFVCGAVVAALAVRNLNRSSSLPWAPVLTLGLVFGGSFLLFYSFSVEPYQAHNNRTEWWAMFFPPFALTREALGWYPSTFFGFFNDPMGFPAVGIAAATFIAGLVRLAERDRALLTLLLAPLLLAFAASLLRLAPFPATTHYDLLDGFYPFFGRVLLFGVPGALLVLGVGVVLLGELASRRFAYFGAAAIAALLATPAYVLVRNIVEPPVIQDMRSLAEQMAPHAEPEDLLLTLGYAEDAVDYYTLRLGLPRPYATLRLREQADVPAVLRTISSIPPGSRFWFATVHHEHWPSRNERDALLPLFDRHAEQLRFFSAYRGDAYLYRRRAAAEP